MKKISKEQRLANILAKAIGKGYQCDVTETIEEQAQLAEQYLIETTPDDETISEHTEIEGRDSHQSCDWDDGMGYGHHSWGKIVDYSEHWHDDPGTRVYHRTLVDSLGRVVRLYHEVGETDYNAPEGYYYSRTAECHVKL